MEIFSKSYLIMEILLTISLIKFSISELRLNWILLFDIRIGVEKFTAENDRLERMNDPFALFI